VAATHARDWPWALALLLLASVAGETIASDNTPPVAYVRSPLTLPFLVIGYGCWALLLREAWARGYLSWAGGIVAGIGYTAFNEGLVAQTWFRPGLNGFSSFRLGRLAGVNWCIVIGLCVFHTLFSMAMPIAAVQLRRAERAPRPWLGRRGMAIAGASIGLVILAMVLGDPAVRRSPDRLTAAAAAVGLPLLAVAIARARRGRRAGRPGLPGNPAGPGRPASRRAAYGAGLGWAVAFYLSYYGLPAAIGSPAIVGEVLVAAVAVVYLRSRPGRPQWTPAHWVALIGGALTPALVFDAFQVTTLETLAVLAAAGALLRLFRRVASGRPPEPEQAA
jgi:hypothetical protein